MERMESSRVLCKQGVAGSNPVTSTNFTFIALTAVARPHLKRPDCHCAQFCAHLASPWPSVRHLRKDEHNETTWTRCCARRSAPASTHRSQTHQGASRK